MQLLKRIVSFLFSRLSLIIMMLLLQITIIVVVILYLSQNAIYAYFLMYVVGFFAVMGIISNEENPSYKLTWAIFILMFPIIGGLFYLFLGNKRMPGKLKRQIDATLENTKTYSPDNSLAQTALKPVDAHLALDSGYIYNMSGYPLYGNTAGEYYATGEAFFCRVVEELKKARKFVFIEFFIIREGLMWNTILDILREKVEEGVEVVVMYDDIGCIRTLPSGYYRTLRSYGIKVSVFNPFHPRISMILNYRDHRKIIVIDGNVGFVGGCNLADEYINILPRYGHWKDTAVMLQGEGVWSITFMFLQLLKFSQNRISIKSFDHYRPTQAVRSDGYVQPYTDSPLDRTNVAEGIYLNMLNRAVEYVYIATPYLIIDNEMMMALITAAQSGLDIRIITPCKPDKWYVHVLTQSHYRRLLEAGIRIYEYTPGFIHAKMFVSDDDIACVSSCNMDYRSFYLHFECGSVFYHSSICMDVKEDLLRTMEVSQEITLENLRRPPVWKRILIPLLKIVAPLM